MRLWVCSLFSELVNVPVINDRLAKDDSDAIDQSNIVGGRTRGAKPSGGYTEPGDEEGLPSTDGTSSTR